ncbi:MAG: leucine-rich repeat domain-containing protein [Muribaculaceae bacterium]
MKKIYFLRLWLIAVMLTIAYSASAYDAVVDGIYYNLNADAATASVTHDGTNSETGTYSGEVTIPAEITVDEVKYAVTEIGNEAFANSFGLTSVVIPNSVTKIGIGAFMLCTALTNPTIPNSVTEISMFAFYYCMGLTNIELPSSVTTIGQAAFAGCTNLATITIPNSVTEIGQSAFAGTPFYNSLEDGTICLGKVVYAYKGEMPANTRISIYGNTVSITAGAFQDCENLYSISLPSTLIKIGASAFSGCIILDNLSIPNSVVEIGDGAFGGTGLTSIKIPKSVAKIGNNPFYSCQKLAQIIVDSENTVYDSRNECNAIIETASNALISGCKNTEIPSDVTEICENAFIGCTDLTSIDIPNSVTKIDKFAFSFCYGLSSIVIPNSVTEIAMSTFWKCENLSTVAIPNSVTSIGEYAFCDCQNLTSITIPKSVKTIGANAFDCNENLNVYVEWENPADESLTIDNSAFSEEVMQNGTLYVPTDTKALYEQTEPWKNFATILEYTVDGIDEIEADGGVTIGVEGGKIVVTGASDAKVEVFDANGAALYSGSADSLPELAAGIYIIRVGSTVKKVAIAK